MERLTRRQLVARGGAVAGAATFGSLAVAREANRSGPVLPDPPQGPARPLKGLALGGFGPLRSPHDPHDYLEWGNREFVRDSHTDVIRMQVSWRFLQPQAPAEQGRVVAAAEPRPRQRRAAPPRPPDRGGQPRRRARDPRPLSLLSGVVQRHDARADGAGHREAGRRAGFRSTCLRTARGRGSSNICAIATAGRRVPTSGGSRSATSRTCCAGHSWASRTRSSRWQGRRRAWWRAGPTPLCCCFPAPRTFPTRTSSSRTVLVATGWPGFTSAVLDGLRGLDTAARRCPRGRTTTIATPRPRTGAATAPSR